MKLTLRLNDSLIYTLTPSPPIANAKSDSLTPAVGFLTRVALT